MAPRRPAQTGTPVELLTGRGSGKSRDQGTITKCEVGLRSPLALAALLTLHRVSEGLGHSSVASSIADHRLE